MLEQAATGGWIYQKQDSLEVRTQREAKVSKVQQAWQLAKAPGVQG